MKRIIQIATGHHPLKANYTANAPLPVLLWALVDDDGDTHLVGMVMDPKTKKVVRADELADFGGYVRY